jgi:hypothetical protein
VREHNALLRGVAIDVRIPGAECTKLPRRTRAELHDSPQRIAAARARLARLRMPNSYGRVRTRLDEGLRLIAEANKLLLACAERSDNPETGECGQSTDNLRDNAYDEFHDLAKPHLQAFMAKHNPIAAQLRATTWELGAAGLIPRRTPVPPPPDDPPYRLDAVVWADRDETPAADGGCRTKEWRCPPLTIAPRSDLARRHVRPSRGIRGPSRTD